MADDSVLKQMLLAEDSSSEEDLFDDEVDLLPLTITALDAINIEGSQGSQRRGSVIGHRVINRDHEGGHARIIADYFQPNPVYTEYQSRRRYAI